MLLLLHFTGLLQVSIFNFHVYLEFWVTHWNITNRSNNSFVCFSLIFNRNSYYFSVNSGFYTALLKNWQLNDQNEPPEVFYKKSCSYKFRNIYRKTPALELVLIKFIKETPAQVFSLWVLQNFKEHLFWRKSVNGCSWMMEIVYLKLKVGNLL